MVLYFCKVPLFFLFYRRGFVPFYIKGVSGIPSGIPSRIFFTGSAIPWEWVVEFGWHANGFLISPATRLLLQNIDPGLNKETIKALRYWPFALGIDCYLVDYPNKGPVMRRKCPCYDVPWSPLEYRNIVISWSASWYYSNVPNINACFGRNISAYY